MSDSLRSHRLCSPWNSPGQNTGVGSLSLLQGIFLTQGSPTLQAASLSGEPQGKPKNTGVGSLFLLQGIFPTQESNWGVSCIAGRFFTRFFIREALSHSPNPALSLTAAQHLLGSLVLPNPLPDLLIPFIHLGLFA